MSVHRNLCSSCKCEFHLCCTDFHTVASGDAGFFLCCSTDPVPSIYLKDFYYTVHVARDAKRVRIRGRKRSITLRYDSHCAAQRYLAIIRKRFPAPKLLSKSLKLHFAIICNSLLVFVCLSSRWAFSLGFVDFFFLDWNI